MAYYSLKSYKLESSPWQIFCALSRRRKVFFLDSSLSRGQEGRFSFLGSDPFYVLRGEHPGIFNKLKVLLDRYKISAVGTDIPFLGGAVGYLSYDLGLRLEEKAAPRKKISAGAPGYYFAFYNQALIIDRAKERVYIFACGFPEKNPRMGRLLAEKNTALLEQALRSAKKISCLKKRAYSGQQAQALSSSFSRAGYIGAVKKAKAYIKAGDIYQVNLSQEFSCRSALSAREIYSRLRRLSPAHFSAFLDCGDFQILSSSPERFLQARGDFVTTRPMKGTRSRSRDRACDIRLKRELIQSRKDKAELMMIVDLERNDLGRVCSYDSVKAVSLRCLESYRTVYQTTATISGRLYPGKDRIDLLRACFPGGSITGCPKIRSMQIIEELEPHRRGIYTGCLGYLSFNRNMDLNILIRSIFKKGSRVSFAAGSGIVADSIPEKEYRETLVKARAMKEALL